MSAAAVRGLQPYVAQGARGLHQLRMVVPLGPGGRSSVSGRTATVFGATGFLGRYVVNKLGQVGTQVQVPYRGDEHDVRHLRVMGDLGQIIFNEYGILDQPSVAKSLKYSQIVINLAGQNYHSRHFSMDDVNVEGARNVARAAKQNGAERLVHVSALGASPTAPCPFLRSKAAGEKAVLEEFPDATIIRPSIMFGIEDKFLNRLAGLHRLPLAIPLPKNGEAVKQPVYVVDVAQGIVNSLTEVAALGRTYEFVGPKQYTVRVLVEYVLELTRKPKGVVGVPEAFNPFFKLAARVTDLPRIKRLPHLSEVNQYIHDDETSDEFYGLEDLGLTPTRLELKALATLRRYRSYVHHDEILEFNEK